MAKLCTKRLPTVMSQVQLQKHRKEDRNKTILLAAKLLHFMVATAAFYIAWLIFRYGSLTPPDLIGYRYNYFVMAAYAVLVAMFNRTYNSYMLGYYRSKALVFAQCLSQSFSAGIIWLVTILAWNKWRAPWPFLGLLVAQFIMNCVWTKLMNQAFYALYPPKRTILVYRNELDKKRFGTIHGKPASKLYRVEKELQCDDADFHDLEKQLTGFEAVFVAGVNPRCRNGIAKYCKENGIPGFFLPHIGDVIMREAEHLQSFDSPVVLVNRKHLNPEYAVAKRTFDIIASSVALILLSPIMLITALAIKLYDGGSPFYRQVRLTEGGREFKILKFRSMRTDAEKDGVARLSSGDQDPRITPIGRFIRKCRIDELPQLFNILKGDMSIVGPRPERPEIAEQYYQEIPEFKLRLQVKAGLTGYAQIYGKYNTDPYEKLEFDLMYINTMNVITDLKLIFATFEILFSGESTEGVSTSSITALDTCETENCSDAVAV